ncbi:MAG: flavodoxin family protein [Oscillospiraceae bacterium]
MKYAVIYTSETGNTKELAENIFVSLPGNDKVITEAESMAQLPGAELYFVGFPVKNRSCGIETMDLLEQIEGAKIALFATCGLPVNEKYKRYVENAVLPWVNDNCTMLGFFLCQGRASGKFREKLAAGMDIPPEELDRIMEMSAAHPDDKDIDDLYGFVDKVTGTA